MLFAYFAPEVTLPVASVLATLTGLALASGRRIGSWVARRMRPTRRK